MIAIIVNCLNIFFYMNLSYYSKGRLITNRFIVMKEFIKVHLIIDLIAILSFYDYSDNTQTYGRW